MSAAPQERVSRVPLLIPCSHTTTEVNKTGSWRFLKPNYQEKTAPCSAACPAGEDIGRVQLLAAQGMFKEAWETILMENPFPGICGRVCFHPCETACNRSEFDAAVAISAIERFLADTAAHYDLEPAPRSAPARPEKVAVVGAGPSGLACAYFLTLLGYRVDVFEAATEPGGILRWAIPEYRLPLTVLRREIKLLQQQGVTISCNARVGKDVIAQARERYRAVFLGCGHGQGLSAGIKGEDNPLVADGLDFLRAVRRGSAPRLQGVVLVVGGGNTAVDVARTARRLGARPVIVYRRRRLDMPAFAAEVEAALEEGVELRELEMPVAIKGRGNHAVVTLQRLRVAGEDGQGRARVVVDKKAAATTIECSRIFVAVGATASDHWMAPPRGGRRYRLRHSVLQLRPRGPAVVFGGDLAVRMKSVVHAVASAKEAAMALDLLFRHGPEAVKPGLDKCRVGPGPALSLEVYLNGPRARRHAHVVAYSELNCDYFQFAPRLHRPQLLQEERARSFAEIYLKISAGLAIREAERCFNCGICNQCDNCRLFCPEVAVRYQAGADSRFIDYDYCKGCGVCVVECPRCAMTLEEQQP